MLSPRLLACEVGAVATSTEPLRADALGLGQMLILIQAFWVGQDLAALTGTQVVRTCCFE